MDVSTSPVVGLVLPTAVADAGAQSEQLVGLIPPAAAGRGVLDGAFAVLDALAHADEGLGLTALARASGLAKTSVHRLAEQLVTVGAVQCVERRYYVGPRMLRIGQRWQPDPLLRRFAQAPVHTLAVQSHAMASMRILHEHRLRYVCAAVPQPMCKSRLPVASAHMIVCLQPWRREFLAWVPARPRRFWMNAVAGGENERLSVANHSSGRR